ncbi:hypothetical protein UlMin_002595 [Ulmus minor]
MFYHRFLIRVRHRHSSVVTIIILLCFIVLFIILFFTLWLIIYYYNLLHSLYDGRGTFEEGETDVLLIDEEKRRQYDMDNRVNPMKRGDMAIAAWAEQQQMELNLRVRRLSCSKHTLILKKRDLMRRKAREYKRKVISQLLAA